MRTIKFRGKSLKTQEWLYGSHFTDSGEDYIIPQNLLGINDYEEYQADQNTVGQYTGLKDKNGKEIYEGDIIEQAAFRYDKNVHRYRMAWIDNTGEFGAFEIGKPIEPPTMYSIIAHFCKIMEVIGNIHDTPELLETTK